VIQQPCAIDMQSIHDQSIDTLADQHQRTLAAASKVVACSSICASIGASNA
jgi:hypothetical protein